MSSSRPRGGIPRKSLASERTTQKQIRTKRVVMGRGGQGPRLSKKFQLSIEGEKRGTESGGTNKTRGGGKGGLVVIP